VDTRDGNDGAPGTADPMPAEPKTELGYAKRLVVVYGNRLRYVPAWRRWLVWDGQRWAHDGSGQASRWMKSIARLLTSDALAIENDNERKAALNLARRGESAAGVVGALTLASTEPGIVVPRMTWTPTRSCSTAPTASWTSALANSARTTRPCC
jgi:putative DNA primase/helicase